MKCKKKSFCVSFASCSPCHKNYLSFLSNISKPGLNPAALRRGINIGWLVPASSGPVDWWIPECMGPCSLSDEFRAAYPEIVAILEP